MSFKSIICLGLMLITAVLLFIQGCGKKEGEVVARVGDNEIFIHQITNPLKSMGMKFISAEAEIQVKKDVLDSMVNLQLLVIGAYEKNFENVEEVVKVVEGEEIKFLLDVLFEEKILAHARPSEAEMKDYYNRLNEEIKASHILVDSLKTANEVLQKLKEGAVFEELAAEYSTDPSARQNQGDLGWFGWGVMVDDFQQHAFNMEVGDVSAPVKSDFGYHIIKLVDRHKIENRLSYDEQKEQIRSMISERKRRTLMQEFAEELKQEFPITVEKPTCQFVLNKLAFLYPDTIGSRPRWRNNIDPAQLNRDEKALPIGRYKGGQLTLGEYLKTINRVPEENRPDFDNYDSLSLIIFQMSLMDIMIAVSRDIGLDEHEDYLTKVRKFRELTMADVLRYDTIPNDIETTEDDLLEYYHANDEMFTAPLRYHLLELQVADEETAMKYKQSIKSERQFRQMASQETLRPGKKQVSGDMGIITRNDHPLLFDAAEKVTGGNISDPVQMSNKWSIVWIKSKIEPKLQEFGASRLAIIQMITKEKGDQLYREWIENMKKRIEIEIYNDVIEASVDKSAYDTQAEADTSQAG